MSDTWLAGTRALASYAWEEALGHFERALVAKEVPLSGYEAAGDSESAALLFGLARAQVAMVDERLEMLKAALVRLPKGGALVRSRRPSTNILMFNAY